MIFGNKILEYWDDIIADLSEMISYPSVCGEAVNEYPYGEAPAQAIDATIEMAENYGLKTKNVGYYAAHAEYGEGEENAVVMAHLDVVPAGEGWDTNPFEMVIKDNIAYGRGVADNKGSAIVALHCLRAIKDAGIVGKRKLRVIFGSGEEIGMDDMKHYFAREQAADMGFTPDADYGICNCEKGIMNIVIEGENNSSVIKNFKAGTVSNAVPYKAECDIVCTDDEFSKLSNNAENYGNMFEIDKTANGAHILAKGVASHAATPDKGINAASHLVNLLCKSFNPDQIGNYFSFVNEKISTSTDGAPIGVNFSDEPSGALTFSLGLLSADEEKCSLKIDIRYPATMDGNDISAPIIKQAEKYDLNAFVSSNAKPLYLPADSKLIGILSGAYESVIGEKCKLYSMGGGTYARQMQNKGVAFGPIFPNELDNNMHNCNERIDLDKFKLHAQVCLEAMYRMFIAD